MAEQLCGDPGWGGTGVLLWLSWISQGDRAASSLLTCLQIFAWKCRFPGHCPRALRVWCAAHLCAGEGWQGLRVKGWPVLLWEKESHTIPFGKPSLCVSIDASCRQSGMAACHLPIWITIERISFFSLFRIPDHLNASCEILSGFDFQRCFFFGLCSAVVCWHYEMPPCCQDWFCSALWNIDIPGVGFCWC